ncbi:MAG: DNA integrity scanning protein DisA nucleotide-binding domain protein [Proteobacteria bacterium]|nr:DNA integrity scanning protein DisA nucleotide-binding domain protein [Pseudomonadota bacterium]
MDLTDEILNHSIRMATEIRARAVLVCADVFPDEDALVRLLRREGAVPVVVASRDLGPPSHVPEGVDWIRVPGVHLTRTGQIKIAVLLGFSRGVFRQADRIVCLSGVAGSGMLDTILIVHAAEEFEIFAGAGTEDVSAHVNPEVFERVLGIATSLGYEGREGKPVGTAFVIGDSERVLALSRPIVLNPFHGYAEGVRNVLDPSLENTLKEFAAIDGAFVIRSDGVVEAAGVYLTAEARSEPLPRGLGARHNSAAGITAATDAVAITVSESTGTVTVFRMGRILIEVERPRPIGTWTQREEGLFPGLREVDRRAAAETDWKARDI